MKGIFQTSVILCFVFSTVVAQAAQERKPEEVLRIYDWKKLQQQHQLSRGNVISMDGMSILRIENATNNPPLGMVLLKISDPSIIKRSYFLTCEMKYENVRETFFITNSAANPLTPFGHRPFVNEVILRGNLKLLQTIPPSAPGGDEHTNLESFDIGGTSNWRLYRFRIDRTAMEGLPTQLELTLFLPLPGNGTIYLRPVRLLGVVNSWWSPQQSGLIGGIGGSVIGCLGGLIGLLVSKGKARNFVLAAVKCFIVLGILLIFAGLIAAVLKQPYAVWYALLLPGVILVLVFSLNLHSIQRRYDELEIRRMTSIDTQ